MNYQGVSDITHVVNAAFYYRVNLTSEFVFEEGKKPWRVAGVLNPQPTTLQTYNENLQIDGSYSFYQYPNEVYMSTLNEDEVSMGDSTSYKTKGIYTRRDYRHSFDGNWTEEDNTTDVYTSESIVAPFFSGEVQNKECRWFKIVDIIHAYDDTPSSANAYNSKEWFTVSWAENIPFFTSDDDAKLYVSGYIDDSKAFRKAWDPDDDNVDEKNNDENPTYYDETKFNTPQVTPLQVSGANNYYCVNVANVQAFIQWLWDDLIKEGTLSEWLLDSITKISGNLYSCITGLKLFPCNIKKHLATVANTPLVLGRFSGGFDVIDASSYNCKIGSVTYKIPSTYGNFLDYQPYTTGLLYLPFVGFSQLDMTVFQPGETMKIDCFVDITTGVIDYAVSIQNKDNTFSLVEHHTGTCGITIPLSYDNASQWMQNFVGGAVKDTVATISGKGATSIGEMASDLTGGLLDSFDTPTNYSVGAPSPSNGLYFPMKPHIVIKSPMYKRPSTYSKNVGFPCMASYAPNTLKGYTVFQNPQLTFGHTKNSEGQKVLPTKEEMDLLYQLMTEGVYL